VVESVGEEIDCGYGPAELCLLSQQPGKEESGRPSLQGLSYVQNAALESGRAKYRIRVPPQEDRP
jgi:hypothetical protein